MEMRLDRLERILTDGVLEIRGDGRAGSGIVLALQALAAVAIADPQLHAQEWPFFSSARKGAPTRGFLRISRRPILKASEITAPHIAILMDPGVATMVDFAQGVPRDGIFVLNTTETPAVAAARYRLSGHVYTIAGDAIAVPFLPKPLGNISVFALLTELLPGFDPRTARERLVSLLKKRRLPESLVAANGRLFDASLGQARHADCDNAAPTDHRPTLCQAHGEVAPGAQSRLRLSRTNLTSAYARTGFRLHFADPEGLCNGCGHCIVNCPENIIQFHPDPSVGVRVTGADIGNYCKLCSECIAICPKGLFTEITDFTVTSSHLMGGMNRQTVANGDRQTVHADDERGRQSPSERAGGGGGAEATLPPAPSPQGRGGMQETVGGALYANAIDLAKVRAAHRALVTQRTVGEADGNTAAAYACIQMWRCLLFPGFPITPSTKWLETVAALAGSGQVGPKRVKLLEAEHAVADYMAGAAAACRDLIVSTATSSVGLDHMTESVRSLGGSGFGNCLLINVYRATANYPLCIEGDPSDTLAHRDDGWIQLCCRGTQQIYDTILQAPCLGMHPEVLTPVMPGYFGLKDSHRSARLCLEPDAAIHTFQDRWIAPVPLPGLINGDTAMGNCVTSKYFSTFKIDQRTRMQRVFELLPQIGCDFSDTFGRPGLEFFETLVWPEGDEVDLVIVGMGPDCGTAAAIAAEEEQRLGIRIGVLAARLLTPFPTAAYTARLKGSAAVLVMNQAYHYGAGHLSLDITQACYPLEARPVIVNGFAGMGGATLSDTTWRRLIDHAFAAMVQPERFVQPLIVQEGVVLWPSSSM